ncbi:DUF2799 domain-containing protein [Chitinimonas sp. BJB300]|uniref:DUF2799 domain-containing protein n=1 Tax=Chitinimonas sp. BJB300 TaxID=1559339 RepID=UPI0013045F35|nr:DUF2799 domain-containing protein [Chitinimonas sp. BJB300]
MEKTLLVLAVLALSGCAAMSEAECRTGDWYGVGERDGRGGSGSRLGDYADACRKAGVLPDPAEYSRGRERGLRTYCTPENGYRVGISGESYQSVCTPETQAGFLREYERGRARYELRRDLDALREDFSRWDRENSRLNDLIGKTNNEEERRRYMQQRDANERNRRDGRIRQLILETRWNLLPNEY